MSHSSQLKWNLGDMKMARNKLLANKESESKNELQMKDRSQSGGVKSSVRDSERLKQVDSDISKCPSMSLNHISSTSILLNKRN